MTSRKIKQTIEKRFSIRLVLLILIIQFAATGVYLTQIKGNFERDLNVNSELTVNLLSKMVEVPLGEFNIPEVNKIAEDFAKEPLVTSIKIKDKNDEVLVSFGQFDSNSLLIQKDVKSTVRDDEKIGKIEIGVSKQGMSAAFQSQLYISLMVTLLLASSVIFSIHMLFKIFVSRPLRVLSDFAKEQGKVEILENKFSDDEFGELSSMLVNMSRLITEHTNNLESQVELRTKELRDSNQNLTMALDQLKSTQDQLIHKSKLAALGQMSAGIAHEINNPLAVLSANTEQLKVYDLNNPKEVENFNKRVDKIVSMALRITNIVSGMRTFSRSDANQAFQRVPLRPIIEETLDIARIKFKNSKIKLEVGDLPDIELECKSLQISQVLINLLGNAFDAVQALPNPWVRLNVSQKDNFVEFQVKDSGSGLPPEVADRLLEPFFTTKEVGKGTGLGLSISFGIAQAHQGSLELDRTCENTCFVMRIPLTQPDSKMGPSTAA